MNKNLIKADSSLIWNTAKKDSLKITIQLFDKNSGTTTHQVNIKVENPSDNIL